MSQHRTALHGILQCLGILRASITVSLVMAFAVAAPGPAVAEPLAFRDFQERTELGEAICPEMVHIPSGHFIMGSPNGEEGHRPDEEPQHQVVIGYDFAVAKTEVTFAQWDACVAAGGCHGLRPNDYGWGRRNQPVVGVSWFDAQAYVQWLSTKTGHRYRLLSEAEWEYAARGGTTTPFYTGSAINSRQANLLDDLRNHPFIYRQKPIPAGSFPANPFGIQDAHGNVWEWVEDCYTPSYANTPVDGSPQTGLACQNRVLRGGSWYQVKTASRSANRNWVVPVYRSNDIGFRVARAVD